MGIIPILIFLFFSLYIGMFTHHYSVRVRLLVIVLIAGMLLLVYLI